MVAPDLLTSLRAARLYLLKWMPNELFEMAYLELMRPLEMLGHPNYLLQR